MFARVATAYADDADHAQRVYDYISRLWFMPATPVLSNGGADRGLPISCFLNSVSATAWKASSAPGTRTCALASNGGGIGTYWGRRPLDRREGEGRGPDHAASSPSSG